MARALRAWAINRGGKNSVRNLQYGPRTRLVSGIYCCSDSLNTQHVGTGRADANELFATDLRRIYTTFILGTALQNFGTRANSFGHGPLDLHGKICSSFFNVDFWYGTPETRTALLNLCVPALI